MANTLETSLDWNDRIGLQNRYSLKEKGWKVQVGWRPTPYGAGLFSKEIIPTGTILRKGILNVNLKEFESITDIDEFCKQRPPGHNQDHDRNFYVEQQETNARLNYVKDYLWGFDKDADERGYDRKNIDGSCSAPPSDDNDNDNTNKNKYRFFGMWIPGNGLNHNENPNTIYKQTIDGIDLVALADIYTNEELFDDYRRHGSSPSWLKEFAYQNNVTLNFVDCNDFVM